MVGTFLVVAEAMIENEATRENFLVLGRVENERIWGVCGTNAAIFKAMLS